MDPISGIEVATASARKLKQQRQIAAFSMLRFVLEALNEGKPLDEIISATGFEWRGAASSVDFFGQGPRSRQDAFARWVGNEAEVAIREAGE